INEIDIATAWFAPGSGSLTFPVIVAYTSADPGLLFDPTTGRAWSYYPSSLSAWGAMQEFELQGGTESGARFVPDLRTRLSYGGFVGDSEAWQDPTTGEWLAVLREFDSVYTCRLRAHTGAGCGDLTCSGPVVANGLLAADSLSNTAVLRALGVALGEQHVP